MPCASAQQVDSLDPALCTPSRSRRPTQGPYPSPAQHPQVNLYPAPIYSEDHNPRHSMSNMYGRLLLQDRLKLAPATIPSRCSPGPPPGGLGEPTSLGPNPNLPKLLKPVAERPPIVAPHPPTPPHPTPHTCQGPEVPGVTPHGQLLQLRVNQRHGSRLRQRCVRLERLSRTQTHTARYFKKTQGVPSRWHARSALLPARFFYKPTPTQESNRAHV